MSTHRLLVMDWFQSSEIELNVPLDKQLAIFKMSIYRRSPKMYTDTHTHPFNDPFSGTTQVSWYQKGKTNLDFTEARDSEWQWHQLGHMQVDCTSLQTDNHASTPPQYPTTTQSRPIMELESAPRSTPAPNHSVFLQAGCPSCHPTDSA